mmetsp:Transcript_36523/g.85719  ORF Transcript_36523/g.85719 Transcript_36523/m.85719 type:complete len:218 (+) Transcript_36523:792-1445(+)
MWVKGASASRPLGISVVQWGRSTSWLPFGGTEAWSRCCRGSPAWLQPACLPQTCPRRRRVAYRCILLAESRAVSSSSSLSPTPPSCAPHERCKHSPCFPSLQHKHANPSSRGSSESTYSLIAASSTALGLLPPITQATVRESAVANTQHAKLEAKNWRNTTLTRDACGSSSGSVLQAAARQCRASPPPVNSSREAAQPPSPLVACVLSRTPPSKRGL